MPGDAHALYESGEYRDALTLLRTAEQHGPLAVADQVLLADLLWHRGEHDESLELASRLMRERGLSYKQQSRLHLILGRAHFIKGRSSLGADKYRVGIEFAQRAGDAHGECQHRLNLFINQVRFPDAVYTDESVEQLRKQVHRLGDPSLTVDFHLGLTELAAKLALLPRARKHLEIARALLPKVNRAIHTRFKLTEIALAAEECDIVEALRLGLELGSTDDRDILRLYLPVTVGHLLIAHGRYSGAEEWLGNAYPSLKTGGGAEIAYCDTMMSLRLSQGRFDEIERWDDAAAKLVHGTDLLYSYYGLHYLTTRVRWLFSIGRIGEGLAVASDAIPRIRNTSGKGLLTKMQLLLAEGLVRNGRTDDGARLASSIVEGTPEPPPDLLADICRVMGLASERDNPEYSRGLYERARQLFPAHGNVAGAERTEQAHLGRVPAGASNNIWLDTVAAARCGERLASLLEMGAHPAILGAELTCLLSETGLANALDFIEINEAGARHRLSSMSDDVPPATAAAAIRIELGTRRNRRYEVHASPRPDPLAFGTIQAIRRVGQAAVTLATARAASREQAALWPVKAPEHQLGLICSSERMLELLKTIRRVAASNATVLLTGETGVGKEMFAKAVHQSSPRSDRVFLPFNCSTVPRDMFDSQLFGHKRGSFTGAVDESKGVIRAAAGGTLFLDEIGEMTIETQPKLLRFLESGDILPLGESKPRHVDVRIVAATNANLDQLVAEGRFREDLYYLLNVFRINIPPLRERREEIPALVEHFLEQFGRELDKPMLRIADETLEHLVLYRWPGNVRQLANEIRRLVAMAEPASVIMPAHLSDDIAESRPTLPANRSARLFDEVVTRIDQPLSAAVEHVERAAIQRALSMTDGRLDEAARMLGLSRKGLYLKRQRLNLG